MRRIFVGLAILLVAACAAYFALGLGSSAEEASENPTQSAAVLPPVKARQVIVADAKIVPAKNAGLSFASPGIISRVYVTEGDSVEEGQLLAKMNSDKQLASVAQAQAELDRAQAYLRQLRAGSRPQEIEALQAALDIAKAKLHSATVAGPALELTIAEAEVRKIRAQLDLANEGTRPEAIAVAAAEVSAAAAALEQARALLAETELRAPFTGVIASLDANSGEYVTTGEVVLVLADTNAWHIEVEDLTELSVIHVNEGDQARFTVDAIPDLELSGTVSNIKLLGVNRVGDITYTATILPEKQDPRFRWNMTTSVTLNRSAKDEIN